LRRCARRFSKRLEPGSHTLRVRSVGRGGALSQIVAVRVRVRLPLPELVVDYTVSVGAGAGVPAPDGVSVWVPVTSSGALVRILQPDGAVMSRTILGVPSTSVGALDTAHADARSSAARDIWFASDAGARIVRVDHGTGATTGSVVVPSRPGGMTSGVTGPVSAAIWAFHFLQGTVSRIDAATAAVSSFQVDGARATGIAWHDGSLWLLTTQPAQVLELDPVTGAVRRSVDLRPPFVRAPSSVDTWSLAPASGALWATLPNYGALARIDLRRGQVRYVRIPYGRPFGVSVGPGGAWVATDRAVLLLDETTGALEAGTLVPSASRTGFVSIVFGNAAAWFTNYDRGTLTRVRAPGAP
jgi:hypothetical protein